MEMVPADFALPGRAPLAEVHRQRENISAFSVLATAFEAMPNIVWVLNRHRQVVFANRVLRSILRREDLDNVYGLRPGEVLGCVHAAERESGCGTTESCTTCGAFRAILTCQREHAPSVSECQIMTESGGEALDLLVHTAPISVEDEEFVVVSAMDISHEKRRRALERTFFHDILNTAGVIQSVTEILPKVIKDPGQSDVASWVTMLLGDVQRLIEEIRMQKDLAAAESNELAASHSPLSSLELLRDVVEAYSRHPVAEGRHVRIDSRAEGVVFTSDRTLLRRVIGNMVKNALEAIEPGAAVTLGCEAIDGGVRFWVHNPTFMPREAQLQVFNRSFSTKGQGRGLGTYSMKLLTERYLKGKIGFDSSETGGTTFWAWYPATPGE